MMNFPERVKTLEIIRSRDNNHIKVIKKLQVKKYRNDNNEYMIEGIRFIEEALESNAKIKYCLCSENIKNDRAEELIKGMKQKGIKVYVVEDDVLKDVSDTVSPQGILAVIEKQEYDIESLKKKSSLIVIADKIQDPGNLGTIIRTSDAAGADAVILTSGTVDPYSTKVLRSTMGSVFHIPVVFVPDILKFISDIKEDEFTVFITSLEASKSCYDEDYRRKTAIVVGNEANGVDDSIVYEADRLIRIPMPGKAESLNAAVASGILLFEIVRQRIIK
jgi:TrmH family RNA methyltransferase